MRIGLDLDGVIVNSIPRWIAMLNAGMGTQYGPDDLPDTYGTPAMAAFCDQHLVELLIAPAPVPEAPAAVSALKAEGHELVVITARTPLLRDLTTAWLDFYGAPVERLHFLEGASKAPTAVTEGIDLMVEDTPHHAIALAKAGVPVLLFAAPYNRDVSHPLIHRCTGWGEVLHQIRSGRFSQRFPA